MMGQAPSSGEPAGAGRSEHGECTACGTGTQDRQYHRAGGRLTCEPCLLALVAEIVLCHEERYDGSGYPRALRGDAIPLPARLFAVVHTLAP
jgi:HD domain